MSRQILDEGLLQMTLFDHLAELRRRLVKVTLAIAVFGGVSLTFAKFLFGILMRPVLLSLPSDVSALVYTSAIEEFNVLMKVGLYAGVFFATPVLLWQIWGFVSPGLYDKEKRLAAPFVAVGSFAFIGGALFCYFVILPTMFEFLLNDPSVAAISRRLETGRQQEEEAHRYLRIGNIKEAGVLAKKTMEELNSAGEGNVGAAGSPLAGSMAVSPLIEFQTRRDSLGRLIDASKDGFGANSRPVLVEVMKKRLEAINLANEQKWTDAFATLDEAAALLPGVSAMDTEEFATLWRLGRELSSGEARFKSMNWTRPMLSMNEQLTLVLVLMLAFGVIFEMPLIMAILGMAGLVTSAFLFKYQRHAFVFCLIVAAIVTPTGDAVNLSLMAGPMFLCYELGVLAVWLLEKRRAKSETETSALA